MIPVTQLFSGNGYNSTPKGDCVRACVASIFERPCAEVPHFVAGEVWTQPEPPLEPEQLNWYQGIDEWMRREGYPLRVRFSYNYKSLDEMSLFLEQAKTDGIDPDTYKFTGHLKQTKYPDYCHGYWIASVMSENFVDATHAIVMLDREVVHDPSPHPRRTPYAFVGETIFVATDPSKIRGVK